MKAILRILVFATVAAGCAPSGAVESSVPGSSIKPDGLLNHTYQDWLSLVARKYQCNSPKIIQVQPNVTRVPGVISEKWIANVCGKKKTFYPILTPDGTGGYLTAIGS
ncbi:MAG: hypothetical protein LBQ32_07325 [Burkholderiaceae bacterium]|jgi:hypothetical protein|nr:hypothetical protein [Burkholderiaceae bacterium]